ncbi:MAG: hypothetical protein KKF44_08685 [Nanoarchaeota archaeon]|nr:hypothetical protein [Nanoarchaeota archaeon]
MIVFIVLPKNSSLQRYVKQALLFLDAQANEKLEVRGEDISFFVKELIRKGRDAIGLTGEDLFREWKLRERETELVILKKIGWNDEKALFNKPVLSLIGPKDKSIEFLPKELSVAIPEKYKTIAKKYLNFYEQRGYTFKKIYLKGQVETTCSIGISDLAIDIVYSGKTIEKLGLSVYDKIFKSNFVIIGKKRIDPKGGRI